ncbi:MAG TPA: sugar-binding protein [Acidisoma sp.]|uniref:sugar-binding protein n=1 Tax=Acidisoma sp. TaxID=1872115 RepID=UPI002BEB9D0D|nr:sugar-binding protein [Acidisoma sp.]HTH99505.1 sugar-binding protein [Acidisoma sp.]
MMSSGKIAVALAAGLLLGSSAVVSAEAASKPTLVFVTNGSSDFWKAAAAGVKKAQSELPDYKLELQYPDQATVAAQNQLMDNLAAAGVKAIIVSAVDPKNSTGEFDKLAGQLALFTTDSDAPQTKRIAYVGSSNVLAGEQAAEIAKKAMPNGGKCMGFVGLLGADNARERIQGFKEGLKGTGITLVDVRGDDMDMTRAKSNVSDTLVADPSITCLVGFYSYNTPQIYAALKESGQLGKVTVVGFDGDPVTLGGVKEGSIAGTVVQQPFVWAYQGMKMMVAYLKGDKSMIPANGLDIIPTKIVDKDTVDAYAAEQKAMSGQ